jgi:hypothetical protein
MLIEEFFEAVDRAFMSEANRIPSPLRLQLKTPLELPLAQPEGPQATPSPERRLGPRRHRPQRRDQYYVKHSL